LVREPPSERTLRVGVADRASTRRQGVSERTAPRETAATPQSRSDAALARYRRSVRRGRAIYYLILSVVVAALVAGVAVAWSRGEAAHESLHTHSPAPPSIAIGSPSADLHVAWRTSDRVALGNPQWGGTVITYSAHTVGGRDGHTGKRTWSYTRSDRTICTAAQLGGTTIAVYANKGNCDEADAFDSATGRRSWTRTLDMDGMPLNGQARYQVLPYTFLAWTSSVIYAVDPVTGYNRWTYQRYGCGIQHVALGSGGALISQNCSGKVRCKNVKFCGRGPQLFLRDGSAGNGSDSKPNADQIKWNKIGDTRAPASAGKVISAVDPSARTLDVLDPGSGATNYHVPLGGAPSPDLNSIATSETTTAQLVWIGGRTYAVRPDASSAEWAVPTAAPPTVASTTGEDTPDLGTARIAVPTSGGIELLSGDTGRRAQQFTVAPPPPGSVVYSLGNGFVVSSDSGIVTYS
jgi:hypothetical protein